MVYQQNNVNNYVFLAARRNSDIKLAMRKKASLMPETIVGFIYSPNEIYSGAAKYCF